MHIHVNGERREIDAPMTLSLLIDSLDLGGRRIAVEHNGEIVPRSRYADTALSDGDEVLIVQAIGGG